MAFQLIINVLLISLVIDAFPMEDVSLRRTMLAQQNLKCNSRSFTKKTVMSNLNVNVGHDCRYSIRAFNVNVCQLRIDFRFFNLAQPTSGTIDRPYAHCADEYLSINGLDFNLCGLLNNQHVYIDWNVQIQGEEKLLHFKLESNSKSTWYIEANQIECTYKSPIVIADELEAPNGCLQYFYKPAGQIESFNYGMNYFGNSRYAICFDKKQNNDAILVLNDIHFKMSGTNFDDSCLKDVYDEHLSEDYISMPHAEVIDASVIQRHNLFCGNSLSGKRVQLHATGPIVIQVHTDNKTIIGNETGFRFRYRLTH